MTSQRESWLSHNWKFMVGALVATGAIVAIYSHYSTTEKAVPVKRKKQKKKKNSGTSTPETVQEVFYY
jgi:hypothetical protein